jgi:hypothetical protein
MSGSTRVTKRVGCDRNDMSQVRMENLAELSINYIAHPCRQGTMISATTGTVATDVVANVKP